MPRKLAVVEARQKSSWVICLHSTHLLPRLLTVTQQRCRRDGNRDEFASSASAGAAGNQCDPSQRWLHTASDVSRDLGKISGFRTRFVGWRRIESSTVRPPDSRVEFLFRPLVGSTSHFTHGMSASRAPVWYAASTGSAPRRTADCRRPVCIHEGREACAHRCSAIFGCAAHPHMCLAAR